MRLPFPEPGDTIVLPANQYHQAREYRVHGCNDRDQVTVWFQARGVVAPGLLCYRQRLRPMTASSLKGIFVCDQETS